MNRFGHRTFGVAAIGLGICTLVWRNFMLQIDPPLGILYVQAIIGGIALLQIAGGLAIQIPRAETAGAGVLAILYTLFGMLWLPFWIRHPLVFDDLGNAFEPFSMAAGAMILCGPKIVRVGYYGFAASAISFAVYQAVHPAYTASLVPRWIPPGQMFWAAVTTIAFAVAAVALLTGRLGRLAAELMTVMLLAFGFVVWVPAVRANRSSPGEWAELLLTFGIAGASWIVADYLMGRKVAGRRGGRSSA